MVSGVDVGRSFLRLRGFLLSGRRQPGEQQEEERFRSLRTTLLVSDLVRVISSRLAR